MRYICEKKTSKMKLKRIQFCKADLSRAVCDDTQNKSGKKKT